MPNASTLDNMSPGLRKVVERAQREPAGRFHALAQLIDVPALERAYRRARSDAAVGVDGVTKEQYGRDLYCGVSGNFRSLLRLVEATKRAWYKWLCRRSQRKRLHWGKFEELLRQLPLPRPRIMVRIWGA